MYITRYEPHNPSCGVDMAKRPKVSTVAHTAKDLSHVLIHHVEASPQLTAKSARAALDGFFVEEPSSDKIYHALRHAKVLVNGSRSEQPRLLLQMKAE